MQVLAFTNVNIKRDRIDMKRREFLKLGAGFLVVCAGTGLGPLLARRRQIYRKTMPLMGTIGDIQVVHDDAATAYRAIDRAFEELLRLEEQLSFFKPDSDVGRINRGAYAKPVKISHETGLLVQQALHWSWVTGGLFEPGLGKVTDVWDVKHRTEPPEEYSWKRLAGREFYKKIRVDLSADHAWVRFLSSDVKIDLGGIAKGYAADRARFVLRENGIDQALINLGGDVAALGSKDGDAWKIGIRDPGRPSEITRVLSLKNQAVATSGTYEQYFIFNGHLYHHLIDPRRAQPGPEGFRSLTIMTEACRNADALATGLFFVDDDGTRRILDGAVERADWIRLNA